MERNALEERENGYQQGLRKGEADFRKGVSYPECVPSGKSKEFQDGFQEGYHVAQRCMAHRKRYTTNII